MCGPHPGCPPPPLPARVFRHSGRKDISEQEAVERVQPHTSFLEQSSVTPQPHQGRAPGASASTHPQAKHRLTGLPGTPRPARQTHTGIQTHPKVKLKVTKSCPTLCDPMDYNPWNSPGQNTGVGSLSLLQGIFLTQGSNPGLPHCRQILYQLSHQGRPKEVLTSHAHTHRDTHTCRNTHRDTCTDICTETHTCAHPQTHTHTQSPPVSHTLPPPCRLTPSALNTVTQAWPTQPHHTWHPPSRVHTLPLPPPGHGTHPSPRAPGSAADSLGDVQEDVRATVSRGDEAMALGPTEAFADSFVDRALGSPHRPDRECGEHEGPPLAL